MWVRIDDGMHNHRKTRAVTKSHPSKARDAAPMGLWTLAASWAGQNGTDGWVPEDELDRWDSDWRPLVARLVSSGYWWPHNRENESGYGFNDWHDYNDPADAASKAGTFGNHVRWHVNEHKVEPECFHCPKEPNDRGDIGGRSGGESLPDSGGESQLPSGAIALPEPEPLPEPDPNPTTKASFDKSNHTPNRFDEFWDTYGNKQGRAKCETAYAAALKKSGVTEELLITTADEYALWCRETDTYIKNPLTWLHGEHWNDERAARQAPLSNVQQHLALARNLAEREQAATIHEIGASQ